MDDFLAVLPVNSSLDHFAPTIRDESYDELSCTLQVWGEALHQIQRQGIGPNINTEIPDFNSGLFDRATAAGHAQKNVMSLFRVL